MTTPCDVPTPSPRNGAGHAALILGLASITLTFVPIVGDFVAIPAAVGATIAGYIGFDRVDQRRATNRGEAIVGACLGVLTLLITLIIYAAVHGPE